MQLDSLITPSEKRLAALLLGLSVLGAALRMGRSLSPEVEAWLRGPAPADTGAVVPGPAPGFPESTRAAPPTPPAAEGGGMEPPVDPNRAGAAELIGLPGVGPVLARRILEDRAQNGPFRTPEDLLRVPGIGPATLKRLRPRLTLSSPGRFQPLPPPGEPGGSPNPSKTRKASPEAAPAS